MNINAKSGAALAATAFTLALGLTAFQAAPSQAAGENLHCYGVNACKGQAECKTASNACKGQAACKGQGWVSLTADECSRRGGEVK